jgi:hypothetical protein
MAAAAGWTDSGVATATYTLTLQAATPTFSPLGGTYNAPQSVVLSSASPGVTIYYATNGSTPTASSTPYTGPKPVTRTTTIKARAIASGWTSSTVASTTYTLKVATPTFSPPAGTYTGAQTITLSVASPGATIYYTTNGSTPTTKSTRYTRPIVITRTRTIKAIAAALGWSNSAIGSARYVIN